MTSDLCSHQRATAPAVDIAESRRPSPNAASARLIPHPDHTAAIVTQDQPPSFGRYQREQSQRLQSRR